MHKIEIKAEADIFSANRRIAEENREFFKKNNIIAMNIMGATGSGKTLLIEKTVSNMDGIEVGAILGDVVGKADYDRVARHGIKAEMINTGKECHLDAHFLHHSVSSFKGVKLLFIENVGNMVCPADFDLGEEYRVVMVSVTEGDDVVEKHPEIFRMADVIIINKVALADAVEANIDKMVNDARELNARAKIFRTDLKKGIGFEEWIDWLKSVVR